MKKALCFAASLLAIGVAAIGPVSAADMYRGEAGGYKDGPAYVTVATWTGFYLGVNGGYGWNVNDGLSFPGFKGLSPEGGFGGGQIGYNWQRARLVLGVEADIQGADISDSKTASIFRLKSNLDWFGTVRGRIGYGMDSALVYLTGGFAFGGIKSEISGMQPLTADDTATGYVLGGGVEYKINPAWSLKAEYQYLNLGKNELGSPIPGYTASSVGFKVDDDAFHTVRVGVNYHVSPTYEPLK